MHLAWLSNFKDDHISLLINGMILRVNLIVLSKEIRNEQLMADMKAKNKIKLN